jgi:hypothetical protein
MRIHGMFTTLLFGSVFGVLLDICGIRAFWNWRFWVLDGAAVLWVLVERTNAAKEVTFAERLQRLAAKDEL